MVGLSTVASPITACQLNLSLNVSERMKVGYIEEAAGQLVDIHHPFVE